MFTLGFKVWLLMIDTFQPSSTNWVVFTGAPSSGKTTILELLKQHGYPVVYEVARSYLDEGQKQGLTTKEMRKSEVLFQDEVLRRKIEVEDNLNPTSIILLDRALLDSVAYYEVLGLVGKISDNLFTKHKYSKILFFNRLPLVYDGKRTETEEEASEISRVLLKTYRRFGYHPIPIPLFHENKEKSIESRLEFIKEIL
jgi:predicted ATPase